MKRGPVLIMALSLAACGESVNSADKPDATASSGIPGSSDAADSGSISEDNIKLVMSTVKAEQ